MGLQRNTRHIPGERETLFAIVKLESFCSLVISSFEMRDIWEKHGDVNRGINQRRNISQFHKTDKGRQDVSEAFVVESGVVHRRGGGTIRTVPRPVRT